MRKIILLLLLVAIALPVDAFASIHGVLKGRVVDTDGKGVIGASVRVEGTTRGAVVRSPNGDFTIANIVAGTYKVRVTAVGKAEYVVEVRIVADQVTEINVKLRDEGVQTEVIEVVAKKELVDKTAIGSKNVLSGEDLTNIAREGLASVVGMSAGVTNTGGGFAIRGSRASESQIRYNGLDIGNQFTGGFGAAGSYYAPIVSTNATEEVQVLKGSFSAEVGEALGGVVNTVPKTGRTDRYEGFLRYRTDAAALWGRQKHGLKVVQDGTRYKAIDYGEGHKLQGKNEHLVEFGIGGPLPLINGSTFYISTNYLYEKYRSASYKIYDPLGNNLGHMPDNQLWRKNITGVLSFALTNDIKLITGGMFGMTNYESSSRSWLYANDEGTPLMKDGKIDIVNGVPTPNGIPERVAKQNVVNIQLSNVYARINHTLTESSYYQLTVSQNIQNEAGSRRKKWEDPGYFSGFDQYEPEDKYIYDGILNKLVPAPQGVGDKIIDIYQSLTEIRSSEDGYIKKDFIAKNPLTGYYEGSGNATGSNNAYGLPNAYYTHGNSSGFEFREGSYIQIDGSYTNVFKTGDFDHNAKAGFEMRFVELHRHQNSNPWDGNPFYDIYTDRWGGNIYADNEQLYKESSKPFKPFKFAAYAQDQFSYKGIILSAGLRLDMFNSNSLYRTDLSRFTSIVTDRNTFKDSEMKYQVSPRINITYPITEKSNLSIAYGMYFKTPLLSNIYDNFNVSRIRSGSSLGNPNMEAEKSRQYEVAYRNQLSEDFSMTITSYFKDTYNQLGVIYVAATPDPFYLLDVTEYSNSRGIEFELYKRASNNLGFQINYTLSYSDGTSSSAFDNAGIDIDPYSQKPTFPLATYPLDNDVRHVINYNIFFYWQKGEGPSIGGIYPLENTTFSFTGGFESGSPYTRVDLNGRPISERNAERGPSYWSLDGRVAKSFFLRDWFGQGMKNSRIEFFADMRNILNMRGPAGFYTTTGDPIDDGRTLDREIGTFSEVPLYKEANYAQAESFRSDQYDSYGNRLYNPIADLDGNGIVTQLEKYQQYLKNAETSMKFRSLFRTPFRIWLGFNMYF